LASEKPIKRKKIGMIPKKNRGLNIKHQPPSIFLLKM